MGSNPTPRTKIIAELRTKFPPFKAHIGEISCRTLVANGESSAFWLRHIGELAAASIPKAEAVKIPKSGHFPRMENDSAFNESVLAFFAKQEMKALGPSARAAM